MVLNVAAARWSAVNRLGGFSDGGRALGFFNLGSEPANLEFNQLAQLGFAGAQHVRDLWRQQDLPDVGAASGVLKMTIPVHGVVLYKLTAVK